MSLPWRRRRRDQRMRQYSAGEQPLRGPERAYYQRLAGDYSKVSSNGKLTLTRTHVIFSSVIGASVPVPLQDVEDVRDQKIRRFHVGGHDSQLVIATRSGEIGFLLKDPAAWADAIRGQLPAAKELPPEPAGTLCRATPERSAANVRRASPPGQHQPQSHQKDQMAFPFTCDAA